MTSRTGPLYSSGSAASGPTSHSESVSVGEFCLREVESEKKEIWELSTSQFFESAYLNDIVIDDDRTTHTKNAKVNPGVSMMSILFAIPSEDTKLVV